MIYTTNFSILMRREVDVVTALVDIVIFTAENAIWYYVYIKATIVFINFTINCN